MNKLFKGFKKGFKDDFGDIEEVGKNLILAGMLYILVAGGMFVVMALFLLIGLGPSALLKEFVIPLLSVSTWKVIALISCYLLIFISVSGDAKDERDRQSKNCLEEG